MNVIEMPALQINATEYVRTIIERNFDLTVRHISNNCASQLIAVRSLSRPFHVDFGYTGCFAVVTPKQNEQGALSK